MDLNKIDKKIKQNLNEQQKIRNDLNYIENVLFDLKTLNENEIKEIVNSKKFEKTHYYKLFERISKKYNYDMILWYNKENLIGSYKKLYHFVNNEYINKIYDKRQIILDNF